MKFQANAQDLARALAAASAPISRTAIPALECVLIDAGDRLTLTGTNMDVAVTAECRAAVAEPGRWAVSATDLRAFAASAADATISLDGGERLTFTAGRSRLTLPALPGEEYPKFVTDDATHEVENAAAALAFCAPFASTDESRFQLNGINFARAGAVATDGYRLAVYPDATCDMDAIVPIAAVRVIAPALKGGGRLFVGERTWRAEAEGRIARGKLIGGTFPDWQRIIPRGDVFAVLDADELAAAVAAATLGRAPDVFIRGDGETIHLRGERADNMDAGTDVDANVMAPFAGALSAKYLSSVCAAFAGATITISGSDGALGVRGGDNRLCVLMAIRHPDQAWPTARAAA